MALTIPCSSARVASVEELLEACRKLDDAADAMALASLAPLLAAVSNDRDLIVQALNRRLEGGFDGHSIASRPTILLGAVREYRLHANIWPSSADLTADRMRINEPGYDVAHDHHFHLLTTTCFGPGYITEIYEYDRAKLDGYLGEPVELRFLERTSMAAGQAMLYRAARDVHVQYPPADTSITLSLIADPPKQRTLDQYIFDLQRHTLAAYVPDTEAARRIDAIRVAGHVGNGDSAQLLGDLARRHPCRRTRLAAYEALARLLPDDAGQIWERASDDSTALVADEARARLAALRDG